MMVVSLKITPSWPRKPLHTTQFVYLHPPRLSTNKSQVEVLSKNFGVPLSAWDNIPPQQLFIFPGTKAPKDIADQNVTGSAGMVPLNNSYTYHLSKAPDTFTTPGGSIKIIDPTTFPIASTFSAAVVTVKPGAMREIHWHTTSDEWNFFIAGHARISIYAAVGNARTFDYNAGDCGYVCPSPSPISRRILADECISRADPEVNVTLC
jgi:oxalate decarboxylase family bicupin protein